MVRPSSRRGDDDLGPVTDMTGRVQGRTVTASSRSAYGSAYPHSQPPPTVYDPYLAAPTVRPHIPYRSSAQEPLTEFSGHARQLGAKFFYFIFRALHWERKRVKASDWEQTGPAEGGSVDLELIPSYEGHVAGSIWRSWHIKVSVTLHGTYRVEPY
ncbi:hypothetical protein M9H77_02048 [Catharanthus roseus]|uniref:Uncharacterized protein n=1 Tax=Catharanthus roseus TaxID=4058 RepID=A0ACC0C7B1_CATRO|nr:hypothetical protein M9H77_02048 [Catharanthus roseus]